MADERQSDPRSDPRNGVHSPLDRERHRGSSGARGGGSDGTPPGSFYDAFGSGTLLLLFSGCLLSNFLFQGIFWGGRPGTGVWGLALAPVLGIIVPMILLLRALERPVRAELWLCGLSGRQVVGVVLVMLGTIPLTYALGALNAALVAPDPQDLEFQKSLIPVDVPSFVGGIVAVVLLAPLGEEILFRALLLGTLGRHVRPVIAVILVGVVFGMTHLAPWVVLPIAFLGVILGLLVLCTRTLTAAWLGHVLFNLAGYLDLARTGDVETQALTRLALHPFVLVAAPVLLVLAFRILLEAGNTDVDAAIA